MKEYHNHNVRNISYHIIWIPKYRRRILVGEMKNKLLEIFKIVEIKLDIKIETSEIMPDHIHLFIKRKPDLCISTIIKYLRIFIVRIEK